MGIKTYVYLIFMESMWKIHEDTYIFFCKSFDSDNCSPLSDQRSNTFFLGYGRRLIVT